VLSNQKLQRRPFGPIHTAPLPVACSASTSRYLHRVLPSWITCTTWALLGTAKRLIWMPLDLIWTAKKLVWLSLKHI
jgi:hypothetical protein